MPISNSIIRPADWNPGQQDSVTPEPGPASLHHIRLTIQDAQRFAALHKGERLWLTPAAGCLLAPEVGDLVLASVTHDQGYILTVLERARPDATAEISMPGGLRVTLPQGKLEITAAQGISMSSATDIEIEAEQWTALFKKANIACQTLQVSGVSVQSTWQSRSDICSGTHLQVAARNENLYGSSVRRISGHEESTADSMRQLVARDWSLQAASADLDAKDRVALNANSIQIG